MTAVAAERTFDFSTLEEGKLPEGWKPVRVGKGREGEWKVLKADVPPTFKPLSDLAPNVTRRAVVAQTGGDATDDRFPLLVFEGERFGDFDARVRFQIAGGVTEQMAGLVFRYADEGSFYVVRFSALGQNLRFYKFVGGERSVPIGPTFSIAKGEWHELGVKCTGNRIEVSVDGKEAMPALTDNSHSTGRIGFFTKSDSVAYFSDLKITYRPLESLAAVLVRTSLEKQSRLADLRVLGKKAGSTKLEVLSAKDASEVGRAADETETKVFQENRPYFSKTKDVAWVVHALHDRNGEVLGVVRVGLKTYRGQIESTTIARAMPIVQMMEARIGAALTLSE